jgi:hypothetical protein
MLDVVLDPHIEATFDISNLKKTASSVAASADKQSNYDELLEQLKSRLVVAEASS